jgi:NAD(P)-dependent dehydrogenase (short-subunit alcohol dehydrogenase family)
MTNQRKVALVTGGRRGIGFGVARKLAADGFDLAIAAVSDPAAAEKEMDELRAFGGEVLYCRCDVSDKSDRVALVAAVREKYGRLNVLVNNAGIGPATRDDILEATEENFERVIKVNLQGPYFLTQLVGNYMAEQKKADESFEGAVVFVTSISSTVASINRGEYCMSKAGLSMAVKLWAVRLAEFGIPVYEVRPGIIATDLTAGVKEKYDRLFAEGIALQRRWGTPEDIGKIVASIARGDIAYSTGQVITADGGMHVQIL